MGRVTKIGQFQEQFWFITARLIKVKLSLQNTVTKPRFPPKCSADFNHIQSFTANECMFPSTAVFGPSI